MENLIVRETSNSKISILPNINVFFSIERISPETSICIAQFNNLYHLQTFLQKTYSVINSLFLYLKDDLSFRCYFASCPNTEYTAYLKKISNTYYFRLCDNNIENIGLYKLFRDNVLMSLDVRMDGMNQLLQDIQNSMILVNELIGEKDAIKYRNHFS